MGHASARSSLLVAVCLAGACEVEQAARPVGSAPEADAARDRDPAPGERGVTDLGDPRERGVPDLGDPPDRDVPEAGRGARDATPPPADAAVAVDVAPPPPDVPPTDPTAWPEPAGPTFDETLCLTAWIPGPGPTRDFFFRAMSALGVRLIRQEVRWSRIEPSRGAFDFAKTDALVAAAEAAGVSLILLLGYGNPWASVAGAAANDEMFPPDDPADFGRFAGAMAARYIGRVARYEIWNEQNAGYRFWRRAGAVGGDPVAYAALLRAAGEAIHAADPAAQVGYGGLFYVPQVIPGAEAFLRDSLIADPALGQAFEAVAYHPYPPYPPRVPPERRDPDGRPPHVSFGETATALRAVLDAAGTGPKALWVTEYGWPTLSLTEEDQARWSLRGQLLLWAAGVEMACLYTYMDGDPTREYLAPWEQAFGLWTWDPTPDDPGDGTAVREKVAAVALRRAHETLGAARLAVDLAARHGFPEGVHGLGLVTPDQRHQAVLWAAEGPAEVLLPWRGGLPAAGLDLVSGEVVPLEPTAEGWLRVPATTDPLLVPAPP